MLSLRFLLIKRVSLVEKKTEFFCGYNCDVYDVTGITLDIVNRKKNNLITPVYQLKDNYWEDPDLDEKTKGDGLLYNNEHIEKKKKSFSAKCLLTKEFPRKMQDLITIFEILAPTNKIFKKLHEFVSMKIPEDMFPVKLEIPIVPTIYATVSFLHYEEGIDIDPNKLAIPTDYEVSTVQLNFDFGQKQNEEAKE